MDTTLTIRIPADLKKAAEDAAIRNDESLSRVVRQALRNYVAKHAQGDLLEQKGGGNARKNRR
ncbi:hypothetical protein D3C72_1174750 [compost metagenome]